MSIYIKAMLESPDNDSHEAEVAKCEAEEIAALGAGASTQAVEAPKGVKTLEAKLTATTA